MAVLEEVEAEGLLEDLLARRQLRLSRRPCWDVMGVLLASLVSMGESSVGEGDGLI